MILPAPTVSDIAPTLTYTELIRHKFAPWAGGLEGRRAGGQEGRRASDGYRKIENRVTKILFLHLGCRLRDDQLINHPILSYQAASEKVVKII